ncbi:MAG: hypothetical protein J7L95_01220 [Prolixibacteraceae bacterium]|nr:hypothetical protein [Prolixibacteraceae bacterium]
MKGDSRFTVQYFKDNYYGFQYGVGVDVWMLTLDARMDYGSNDLYVNVNPSFKGKNHTFMVSVEFKIL